MLIRIIKDSQLMEKLDILDEDIINGAEIFIGREDDCHIILESHKISRYHASIQVTDGHLLFKVLSDYGGVTYNDAQITSKTILEKDTFKVFDYEIEVSDISALTSLPLKEEIVEIPNITDEPTFEEPIDSLDDFEDSGATDSVFGVAGAEGLDEYSDMAESAESNFDNATEIYSEDLQEDENKTEILDNDSDQDDAFSADSNDEFAGLNSSGDTSPIENDSDENEFNEFRSENYEDDSFMNEDYSEDTIDSTVDEPIENSSETYNEAEYKEEETESTINSDFAFGEDTDDIEEFSSDDNSFTDDFGGNAGFDGDEGGESFGDDGSATQVFSSFANYYLELIGEYAPFDKYHVVDQETHIGRDPEKCQIVLDDPEVSKIHAILKKSIIGCVLEDFNSSNGIIFNGERVNRAELVNDDEFIIGDTAFTVVITSDIIEVEKDRLMPVEENQEVEIEEIVEEEVDYDQFGDEEKAFGEVKEKSLLKRVWGDKRKRLYLIVGIIVLVVVLLDDEPAVEELPQGKTETKVETTEKPQSKFSPEILEKLEQNYTLALAKSEAGEYYEAKEYIDVVMQIDPEYREGNAKILKKLIQEGYDKLIKIREEEQAKKERLERQTKVSALLKKAIKAVDERNAPAARKFFGMILELDPENPDITPLKIDLDAWEAEEKRKKEEAALAKARRQSMVDKLTPGRNLFLKQDWYKAIDKLEKFLDLQSMDEDLIQGATDMLQESKAKLSEQIDPLLSKARSFKDGQDLKQAYETYDDVLRFEPSNEEALNEKSAIYALLLNRSKRVYREALVSESLSLYPKAKEKFQEVQQISPINSKYYIKATDKLKNYLE